MIGLIRFISILLSVTQGILSHLRDKTLVKKGQLERDNASLKESIRRAIIHRKASERPAPDSDGDILDRM